MATTFERVVDVFEKTGGLDGAAFTPATTLEETGLDSLLIVEAVMGCEAEFGIEIDPSSNPATLGEVVELIEGILAQ